MVLNHIGSESHPTWNVHSLWKDPHEGSICSMLDRNWSQSSSRLHAYERQGSLLEALELIHLPVSTRAVFYVL